MACCSKATIKLKQAAYTKAKTAADSAAKSGKKVPPKKTTAKKATAKKAKGCSLCGAKIKGKK